ncbi:MAG TPA: calcium-binding protein [Trichocoleus sp.]|jgi:Ca2+-binding RTX toxin-like protein
MSNTTQLGLDALLALLEKDRDIKSVKKRRFQGTFKNDVYLAVGNSIAAGKRGDDVLSGKDGNDRLSGDGGNDLLFGGNGFDVLSGGNNQDMLFGNASDDQMDGGNGSDMLDGGIGVDTLIGGGGNDQLVGGDGIDTLTGGTDRDQFIFNGNVFANGTPALAGQTGIKALNQPDIITDYTIGEDQFLFDKANLNNMVFQKGNAAEIASDANVIVLLDAFPAAGAAARAIANNANIQADEGVFVYFNSTLGLSRVVHSKDLGDGGNISVLANLSSQRGAAGLANMANFSAADFGLS